VSACNAITNKKEKEKEIHPTATLHSTNRGDERWFCPRKRAIEWLHLYPPNRRDSGNGDSPIEEQGAKVESSVPTKGSMG
jgi:hypothetical protein